MDKALTGLRILNTRPIEQGKELTQTLTSAGAEVVLCPLLAIKPLSSNWVFQLPQLSTIDIAIFISANAVFHCFETLQKHAITWPKQIRVLAIGKATASKLNSYGITSVITPTIADSEHLLTLPKLLDVKDKNILLFKGQNGLPTIQETLKKRQANLQIFDIYTRIARALDPAFIQSLWQNNAVDIILITSETALQYLLQLFEDTAAFNWLCHKPFVLISERLAQAAKKAGILETHVSTNDTILDTLITLSRTRA